MIHTVELGVTFLLRYCEKKLSNSCY